MIECDTIILNDVSKLAASYKKELIGDKLTITLLTDKLTIYNASTYLNKIETEIETTITNCGYHVKNLILDVRYLKYIDSSGIGFFLSVFRKFLERIDRIILGNQPKVVSKAIEILGAKDFFNGVERY